MTDRVTVADIPGLPVPFRRYYSNAVRVGAGDLLFISGQVAWDEHGSIVGEGDGPAQARQVFENLRRILAGHGATLDDVVKVIVYVTDFSWFDQLSELRERLFPAGRMASTIVRVTELVQPGLLIEIEAVAVVG